MIVRDRYSSGYFPTRFLTVNYWPQSRVSAPDTAVTIRRGGFAETSFDTERQRRQRRQIQSFVTSFLSTQG